MQKLRVKKIIMIPENQIWVFYFYQLLIPSSSPTRVLDSILDSIERDVARRTQEARQALLRKNAATVEPKKEDIVYEHDQRLPRGAQIIHQTTPTLVQQGQLLQKIVQPTPSHSQPVIQYVQVPFLPRIIGNLCDSK